MSERRKVWVDVVLKNDRNGNIRPLTITWEDDTIFTVDRVIAECNAASTRVGGCGVRYTVVIAGKQTYLFHEDDRWFVEGK